MTYFSTKTPHEGGKTYLTNILRTIWLYVDQTPEKMENFFDKYFDEEQRKRQGGNMYN